MSPKRGLGTIVVWGTEPYMIRRIREALYSVMTKSAHSTRETKIGGLPNFAPSVVVQVPSTKFAQKRVVKRQNVSKDAMQLEVTRS
jgi:hypothetical protein